MVNHLFCQATINTHIQSLMSDTEYEEIVTNNIILELNDDSPESKLLGIQIDIDWEDKNKSFDDIN